MSIGGTLIVKAETDINATSDDVSNAVTCRAEWLAGQEALLLIHRDTGYHA